MTENESPSEDDLQQFNRLYPRIFALRSLFTALFMGCSIFAAFQLISGFSVFWLGLSVLALIGALRIYSGFSSAVKIPQV